MKRFFIAMLAFVSISFLPYQSLQASLVGGPDCGCGPSCGPGPCGPCGPCDPCGSCCEPCCCNYFDGFYIGGNIGWAAHDIFLVDRNGFGLSVTPQLFGGTLAVTLDGFIGGFQVGYNWTCCCNTLFGVEFDWDWTSHCRRRRFTRALATGETAELRFRHQAHWFGTLRGRAGILTPCNLLLYGTLGAAFKHQNHRFQVFDDVVFPDGSRHRHSRVRWGAALGVGAEWACSCLFSIKAEGLILKFPEHSRTITATTAVAGTQRFGFSFLNTIYLVRVGANFNLSNWCFCW